MYGVGRRERWHDAGRPVGEVESLVLGQVPAFCSCRPSRSRGPSARCAGNNGLIEAAIPGDSDLIEALGALDPVWDEHYPAEQARILRLLIERIDVASDGISVTLHAAGFAASSRSWRTRSIPPRLPLKPCWRPRSND